MGQSRRCDALQPIKTAACLTPDVTCRSFHGRPYVTCSWSAASSASANSTWSKCNLLHMTSMGQHVLHKLRAMQALVSIFANSGLIVILPCACTLLGLVFHLARYTSSLCKRLEVSPPTPSNCFTGSSRSGMFGCLVSRDLLVVTCAIQCTRSQAFFYIVLLVKA